MDILRLLLAFFRPGIEGDEKETDTEIQAETGTEIEIEQETETEVETETEQEADSGAELETARREARELKESNERYQRELADARQQNRPRQDDVTAQEDAVLNDPKTEPLAKWQIQANRALRHNTNAAQAALAQSQDLNDRTAFQSIAISDPVAKKYEVRVEKELATMRTKGQSAPREAIYTYLLGKDMREGKFKKAAAKPGATTVNRGRLPGARSDVRGNGAAKSEHDKRIERLRNQQI